ncbi:hypothetical protein H0H87_001596 [Tephrocybe sp. NHM501043]|nr:hypothetical protein H0H87_001596 [Tephrocybe sp. NHM501043]
MGAKDLAGVAEDPLDRLFQAAQNQRQNIFLDAEKDWDHRFQLAEVERDGAEPERAKVFDQKAADWSRRAKRLLESHDERFHAREEARSDQDSRRDAAFEAAQEQRAQAFDMSLTHIEKQAITEENLEDLIVERQKRAILALLDKQMAQLNAAKDDRRCRFALAQQRRNADLGVDAQADSLRALNSSGQPPRLQNVFGQTPLFGSSTSAINTSTISGQPQIPQSQPTAVVAGRGRSASVSFFDRL